MALLNASNFNTHIYSEILTVITRGDGGIITQAINYAEEEAKAYLNRFDTTAMFSGINPSPLLVSKVLDLASWHLIKLANPNINLELFRTSYEDAIKFFEKVQKGILDPSFPIKQDDPNTNIVEGSHISFSSNPKRNNFL